MLNFKSLAAVTVLLGNIDIALGQGAAWSQCEFLVECDAEGLEWY